MSTAQGKEDLGELQKEMKSWAGRLSGAEAFHRRREEVGRQIQSITGSLRRDPNDVAAVQDRFFELKEDLPILENLHSSIQRARQAISELATAPAPPGPIRQCVEEWTAEWSALLEHIVRNVGDRKGAPPAISQAKQLEAWAIERNKAVVLLRTATDLLDSMGPNGKAALEPVLRAWTKQFCDEHVNAKWLLDAGSLLTSVQSENRAGKYDPPQPPPIRVAPPPPSKPPQDPPSSQAPQPDASSPVIAPPPTPSPTPSSQVPLYQIGQLLAECRDLAEALRQAGPEIAEFEARQFQLRHQPDSAALQELNSGIETFRQSLVKSADEESEKRLRKLQLRWKWFQALYDERRERGDVAAMVKDAEDSRAAGVGGIRQFFENVEIVEERIYAIVNANRPRIASFVRKTADDCRAIITDLRQQPRLVAETAELDGLEKQLPEDPSPQVNAQESFKRLETCLGLLQNLHSLRDLNILSQNQALTRATALQTLASSISVACDGRETENVAELARRIPRELPSNISLDETSAALTHIERDLGVLRKRVTERSGADLTRLRKENLAWIRLLAEFAPEAEELAVNDPPPAELELLQAAIDTEKRHQQRVTELTARAVRRLSERGEQLRQRLREHLDSPEFETHPERATAAGLLASIDALPILPDAPQRDAFTCNYDAIAEGETFIDRLESARREMPGKVQALADRFDLLRERNALKYREALARRGNALLLGMRKTIDRQQWEPLRFQIEETNALIAALERDALVRICADTEELVDKLNHAKKLSTDEAWIRQVESTLNQLDDEGHLEPPSYAMRQRLSRLLTRGAANQETRRI
jgi:hypothetical protein